MCRRSFVDRKYCNEQARELAKIARCMSAEAFSPTVNGAIGTSDVEGKVGRVSDERVGKRTSFNPNFRNSSSLFSSEKSWAKLQVRARSEIQAAIPKLSREEIEEIREWIDDYLEDRLELTNEVKAKLDQSRLEIAAGQFMTL